MVALGRLAPASGLATDRGQSPQDGDLRRWHLVGTFATYEKAEQRCEQLRSQGTSCAISMIGGLSVIAFD